MDKIVFSARCMINSEQKISRIKRTIVRGKQIITPNY